MKVLFLLLALLALSISADAQAFGKAIDITPNARVVRAGDTAQFTLWVHPKLVGTHVYVVGASFETAPPFNAFGVSIPLVVDDLFIASLVYANTSIFQNTFGVVAGMKTRFAIRTINTPFLFGIKFYLSALLFDGTSRFFVAPVSSLSILPSK
jgi:hypothetical protein